MRDESPEARVRNWPPEQGWPLFGAWMGGLIVVAVLYIAIGTQAFAHRHPTVWLFPSLIGRVWEAWLLFRRHPARFVLWSAAPLLYAAVPGDPFPRYVVPLIEAVILRGVRRRSWIWILASVAGLTLSSQLQYFTSASGNSLLLETLGKITTYTGAFAAQYLYAAAILGVGSSARILCGAILAWKMPPVRPVTSREIASI